MGEPEEQTLVDQNARTLEKAEGGNQSMDALDFSGVHWGYLNCWQSVVRGKKIKTERWFTYWVDLCGSTMRLYKDKSLPPDSGTMTPSLSVIGPSPENEQKVAFFDLRNATVELMQDGTLYNKKLKQADYTRIFRRHLFRVAFLKLNSTYVFQAPSNSSMLRWVSKIQEAITMSEYEQIGGAAVDERLQLAKFSLEQRRWKTDEMTKTPAVGIDSFEDEEDFKKAMNESTQPAAHPRLQGLKDLLREKLELLNQLSQQEKQFLGSEAEEGISEVVDKKLTGTALSDYYIVPSRRDTFVCKGAKMTLFGQLPNKRWRCWIEIDNLVASMNNLISDEDNGDNMNNNGEKTNTVFEKNKRYIATLTEKDVIERGYPFIGSVPTSLVEELQTFTSSKPEQETVDIIDAASSAEADFISETPPTSPVLDAKEPQLHTEASSAPYSSHARRTPRKTNSQLSFDSFFFNGNEKSNSAENVLNSPRAISGNFGSFHSPVFYQNTNNGKGMQKVNITVTPSGHSSLFATRSSPLNRDDSPASSANSSPVMPVKLREGGFIIKKRLRQKGISIIVGSSSSEEESSESEVDEQPEDEDSEQKNETANSIKRFSTTDVTEIQHANLQKNIGKRSAARSVSTLPPHSTHSTELLDQFGLRSASVSGCAEKGKLFPKFIGPDVKPPRNERRTLKLSKSPQKGFGFYLQTYVFTGKTGEKDVKTFVRYVEEEGPAYLAGLREGDVIVEIDGEKSEMKDHAQLVNAIKNSDNELIMVVKFIDAVRRADLCIKLKKKRARLRARVREYEDLVAKENDLLKSTGKDASPLERSDSVTSSGIGLSDDSSENLASINEQVIIQTSRFEERSSKVFDSVKEIRYNDDGTPNSGNARTHITTASDLLSAYSTDAHAPETSKKSKPVHRSRSFSGSEKKIDRDSIQSRGRLNSKDDGFITASPSLTKSRPPAKIISNRNSASEYAQKDTIIKDQFKSREQMFYDPSQDRSGLPVKSRLYGENNERMQSVSGKDGILGHSAKIGSLSHPSKDRVLSRNSRAKSYKIAVTTGQGAGRKVAERLVAFEEVKTRKAPETDL